MANIDLDLAISLLTVDNNWTEAQVTALRSIIENISDTFAEVESGQEAMTLGDLADVDTDGATNGQQLTFDDGDDTWKPGAAS